MSIIKEKLEADLYHSKIFMRTCSKEETKPQHFYHDDNFIRILFLPKAN